MIEYELKNYNKLLNFNRVFKKSFVIYNDSDSAFVDIDEIIKLYKTKYPDKQLKEILKEIIDLVDDLINNKALIQYANIHNIIDYRKVKDDEYLLPFYFKNEMFLTALVMYSKKRYIGIIYDLEKDEYYIDLKGVEGKRNTAKIVLDIVFEFIDMLKDKTFDLTKLKQRKFLLEIIDKYMDIVYKYVYSKDIPIYEKILYMGFPVTKNKDIKEMKSVQSAGKGMIVFDYLFEKLNGYKYWETNSTKGYEIIVKLKNLEFIDDLTKLFEVYENIKINKKNIEENFTSITIPEDFLDNNDVLKIIDENFELHYEKYLERIRKKIYNIYKPFFIKQEMDDYFKHDKINIKTSEHLDMVALSPDGLVVIDFSDNIENDDIIWYSTKPKKKEVILKDELS